LDDIKQRLYNVENTSRDLIQFGIFVTAAAFIGVAFAQLLSYLNNSKRQASFDQFLTSVHISWPDVATLAILAIVFILVFRILLEWFGNGLSWLAGKFKLKRERGWRNSGKA
jgi:uncharacterized BrkB/YihY/UPF0761 family membrane protein